MGGAIVRGILTGRAPAVSLMTMSTTTMSTMIMSTMIMSIMIRMSTITLTGTDTTTVR